MNGGCKDSDQTLYVSLYRKGDRPWVCCGLCPVAVTNELFGIARRVESNDFEAVAAIREAERIFNQERARGATAFKVESGKPVERIEQFDRTAEQIVMVPRVVGG